MNPTRLPSRSAATPSMPSCAQSSCRTAPVAAGSSNRGGEVWRPGSISPVARGEQLRGRFDVRFAKGDNGDGHGLTSGCGEDAALQRRPVVMVLDAPATRRPTPCKTIASLPPAASRRTVRPAQLASAVPAGERRNQDRGYDELVMALAVARNVKHRRAPARCSKAGRPGVRSRSAQRAVKPPRNPR